MFQFNKDSALMGLAVLAIIITGVLVFDQINPNGLNLPNFNSVFGNSAETVAQKSIEYLNNNVLQGQTATLKEYSQESGVIKIKLEIQGSSYDSYATKDGKLFFPEALKIESSPTQ